MMWKRFFVERIFFWFELIVTIVINWISFWWLFLRRLLLTNCFLFCLWSDLFCVLKWDFIFIAFICRAVSFTIFRFATFTFLRTIFLRRYSCKTNSKLLARKLFDIDLNHCSFKTFKYAINWAINWLFRWWSNLIFCSTIVIQSLMKLICFFRESQKLFSKRDWFRYFIESQSISLSNSIKFWNIIAQQKFDKVNSMKIILVNYKTHVEHHLTNSDKDV
jgi:hypothetical protein